MKKLPLLFIATLLVASCPMHVLALSTSQTATQNSNRALKKNSVPRKNTTTQFPANTQDNVASADSEALLVTVTADRDEAYVNEQILVTLEVGAPQAAFAITGESLQLQGSQITALEKSLFSRKHEKEDYQFVRIVYALFVEKAGEVVVPPVTYTATMPVAAQTASGSDAPDSPQNKKNTKKRNKNPRLRSSSRPLKLLIEQPPTFTPTPDLLDNQNPAGSTGEIWLPAIDIILSSSWEGATVEADTKPNEKTIVAIAQGTPVQRHILIEITGQHAERVPLHEQLVNDPQRQYADQPVLEQILTPVALNGTKRLSSTIIAPAAGTYTLPALTIDWWDINRKTWRTTRMEEEQLDVIEKGPPQQSKPISSESPPLSRFKQHLHRFLPAIATVLGVTTLVLALLCFRFWQRLEDNKKTTSTVPLTEKNTWRALRKSFKRKDLHAIRKALLAWAQALAQTRTRGLSTHQNFQRLEQVKTHWPQLSNSLTDLESRLYSSNPAARQEGLEKLRRELEQVRRKELADRDQNRKDKSRQESDSGLLKPLYRQ